MVRFFTMEQFHAKQNVGSTKIRVHNLIKYWDEAGLYQYGEKPNVLVFQKVYVGKDYKFPVTYPGIKILDICDPDWLEGAPIKETVDAMDAVVCPTKPLAEFIRQLTDKPVMVIKDRFDLAEFPKQKMHRGTAKTVVWFGYHHNAGTLKLAVQSLERRGLKLKVIADQDPFAYRWAFNPDEFAKNYEFVKYLPETAHEEIQKADICVLPIMKRPQDRFKSENKTVIAQLLGIPVVNDADGLDSMMSAQARNQAINTIYGKLRAEYDCKKSVQQMKGLINELRSQKP